MAAAVSSAVPNSSLKCVEWMWQSNPNPWSKSESAKWSHYSDVENLIMERAYSNGEAKAVLDDYYIDFKQNLQIFNMDDYKRRPVKRVVRKREDKHLREERFVDLPVNTGRSFGGQYGWVSPFIIEVQSDLKLEPEQLASKSPDLVQMLVDKAAEGIIKEGKHIRKEREAKEMADMLREKRNKGIEEVWKRCAYLYSLESFLYKTLNATMRLVGDKDHDHVWRSKVRTLGPFCLLLWDDPLNIKAKTDVTLYRGANLSGEQIAKYEEMAKDEKMYGSFQAFTSCSRNREKTEEFGNTLFIMELVVAFTVDLAGLSEYPNEEEELVAPGVCFCVKKSAFDPNINKHLIYLELRQQFSRK
ncbi:unnamed protein product [Rotaria magnacalcarata]|uniref:NAD(P)(+)--arginine ADP-ribosyltransferase n=1 Tax=Rotaria magnacalcarata TaxID=392030 RepID=A0A814P933_9BILA|nr:unnamed protein product [Rotaria magnacalcarata]CAF2140834.1 unnamed protein product [Rotaria magnacalcarata]CAF3829563.1 unnamed protein product [Rotaria magnacalcarata]CAF3953266.1 unnamed protein product [Rotaria magnacalcarata]CAF4141411.1 unnamed protein product [Rotaria magnacalcarata]